MIMQTVPVGLGELKVSTRPNEVLACYGLGSCVGIALYDAVARVGVMLHVVLPSSRLSREKPSLPGKYADTGVAAAVSAALHAGADLSRLFARMAGGARMFEVGNANPERDIGARNVEAVLAALKEHRIPLLAGDTGGNYGRTIMLFVGTGRLLVSTVGRGEREL
jgi:chemotaxis protein CheD